ncbi:MAG: hypothetical protein JWM74_2933, partial [Myxococcaceae bacterium]|nr:hypothetical protein [Myxococcaceae bacterium]
PAPAALGAHVVRLRPASHVKAKIESYGLRVSEGGDLRWQQDPYGNHVARITFLRGTRLEALELDVELALDVRPVNPFDFMVDDRYENVPFTYADDLAGELHPFLDRSAPCLAGGPLLNAFLAELPATGRIVPMLADITQRVATRTRYVVREEAGVWTPEQTLAEGRGSCRDSALLLIAALRDRGLAARFVSGYLIQLTDEGMIPGAPRGVGKDVADLHAWAEVYLPGAGWIGLDATSGLFCGEGHIPLACTASPSLAAPIEGTSDLAASGFSFELTIGRLGHEPRPTAPYEEPVWEALLAGGDRADAQLAKAKLPLTVGGEPTFNAREDVDAPEWNVDALGASKWTHGEKLAAALRTRLAPDAAVLVRQGKHYPGEPLPRWAIDLVNRTDGKPAWTRHEDARPGEAASKPKPTPAQAHALALALARRLDLADFLIPAHEDPWRLLQTEASLPVDVDPLAHDLDAPAERQRLARILGGGMASAVGYVLPLARNAEGPGWRSSEWRFRRGHLFLLFGDSPLGLRLPLDTISKGARPPRPREEKIEPPDPRVEEDDEEDDADALVKTALAIEARGDALCVFLPPVAEAEDFFALVALVEAAAAEVNVTVRLEGYPPPPSPLVERIAVTPDPGVLEVNLPPTKTTREHAKLLETVFDAALHAGLHSEKYLMDGRQAGSGGGNHQTLGGPTPLTSPFITRPDLLASLLVFVQHHPSLSYMFTGLFVGPTSQAPRLDEARHDALAELEIALDHAFLARGKPAEPWLSDRLFRNLLVDVAGNTHRTEICIDKLFSPHGAFGRQGLVELRAFEMPPHPRMAAAQAILLRALVAAFAEAPYRGRLVRWGTELHDRFLLPHFMWSDFADVLAWLSSRGIDLPADGYRPFLELRCPVVGSFQSGDVRLEVRNAIEPWNVLGEEASAGGTSRYVDSSMERIEVRVEGFTPGRHEVLVNGLRLPLRPTSRTGELVGGVRFRAWAPPHSLQAHLGIHHPVRLDVVDTWGKRSIGACAYHVWHPGGRAFDAPPLTRFEAAARRAQRFTVEAPIASPVTPRPAAADPDAPLTLDLRRFPGDRPPPEPEPEPEVEASPAKPKKVEAGTPRAAE